MTLFLILAVLLLFFSFFYYRSVYTVPTLMYHRIASVPHDRNALPKEKFEEQLRYLSQNGFTCLTMEMAYDVYRMHTKPPKKSVLLTFDDGYIDNYNEALPLLQKYQMSAVVFPISNWLGKENKWEAMGKQTTTTMSAKQLKRWQEAGMEVGAHTMDHPFLTGCSADHLLLECEQSKKHLEKLLATPIHFLCYPYGYFNKSVQQAAKAAGFKAAFAICNNIPLFSINLYTLPRIPIPAHQSLREFRWKVSRFWLIFIALRNWEHHVKKWLHR